MNEAKMLQDALNSHVVMNKARLRFLCCFIIALIKVSSVNMKKIAIAFPGRAKRESKYKTIQRFFHNFQLDLEMIAKLIASLTLSELKSWVLTMDRTNWKYGKMNINILTLGVAYKGSAIPLLWIPLLKRGNSNTSERIDIVKRFMKIFGVGIIECLTADREFIGKKWFSFLIDSDIPFRIRIKENILVANSKGILVPAKDLFRMLKPGQYMVLEGKRTVIGVKLFVIGMLLPNSEHLIIVTDKNPETALDNYKQRWEIETLFGCLKTRGFEFESTHMTKADRIEKLVALLALAYCWCVVTGAWLNSVKDIKVKKHGRKEVSVFRHGLNELREILLNIQYRISFFDKLLRQFIKPLRPSFSFINIGRDEKFLSCT